MDIELLQVSEIIPYEKNAKKHPDGQITNIANSLREFGFRQPLVIDKDNVLVIGHGRLLAAKRLGLEYVPVTRADDLSEEQIKALRLADNKLNESEWDIDLLNIDLDDITDIDMSMFGFDLDGLDDLDPSEGVGSDEEDELPEVSEEPQTQVGDLYALGDHRLICGDSTDKETLEILLGGADIDLVLTDPPYGINVVSVDRKVGGDKPFGSKGKVGYGEKGKNKILDCNEYAPIIGDDTTDTAKANYELIKNYSKNQILFGGNYFTDFLTPSRGWVVWDKENTGNFADAELAWTSFEKGVKLYHFMWNGLCREGSREVEGKKRVHPTQKPVGMLQEILNDFSQKGESVLDCFGGSGSTLIACERTGRRCFMMELEPHYVDVIIARWENLTGQKAVKINED